MNHRLLLVAALALLTGCSSTPEPPDLGKLYNRSAQYHGPDRNPVIVIPGILGSRLIDPESDRVVWGAFGGDFADPSSRDGALVCALPMERGKPLRDLTDSVLVDGSLDRIKVKLWFVPLELNAYLNILGTLGVGGYRDADLPYDTVNYGDDHFTCFQFAYDWRRSSVENAKLLEDLIEAKRTYVQKQMQKKFGLVNHDVKFDIVAHSMGGLVARYFLRYGGDPLPDDGTLPALTWRGAKHVERVVFVGTPSAGSLFALEKLVHGLPTAPTLPTYPPGVIGTFPAIYELLPRARHGALVHTADTTAVVDFMDVQLWKMMGWGLADPGQAKELKRVLPRVKNEDARRAIAVDHLEKSLTNAKRFHAALDVPASPPPGTELFLIAGDSVPTPSVFRVDLIKGSLDVEQEAPGDGTVIRQSALMDERMGGAWRPHLVSPVDWSRVAFMFEDHIGMTMDPNFADNVLYMLLEEPRD